jgi:protein SCO1/2
MIQLLQAIRPIIVSAGCRIRDCLAPPAQIRYFAHHKPVWMSGALKTMWSRGLCIGVFGLSLLVLPNAKSSESSLVATETNVRVFAAKGVVRELSRDDLTVTIRHEAISNYMGAMIMPFKVEDASEMAGLHPGDEVTFRLHVTRTDSWVDHIARTGTVKSAGTKPNASAPTAVHPRDPLWYYNFTNELGQPVSLNSFHGQALAITFIYTRCPLPNYCPRLSRNFQEASQKLESMSRAPTNWHFLSISFDSEYDSPEVLKAYGNSYQYDPAHWSFLTGPPDKIAELARASGVNYEYDEGLINHNFRTLIVDGNGHLQMIFPTSGDFSDSIVAEIIKAAAVTNQPTGG